MNTKRTQSIPSNGILESKIDAFIEFLANAETRDKSDQVTLLKRIFELGNDLPRSSQRQIVLAEHASVQHIQQERTSS